MSTSFKTDKDTGVLGDSEAAKASIDAMIDGEDLSGANIGRGPQNLRVRTDALKRAVERLEFLNAGAFFSTLVFDGHVTWHGPDTENEFIPKTEEDEGVPIGTLRVTDAEDQDANGSLFVQPAGQAGKLHIDGDALESFFGKLEITYNNVLKEAGNVLYIDIPNLQERLNRDGETHPVDVEELKNSRNLATFPFTVATIGSTHGIEPTGGVPSSIRIGSTLQLPTVIDSVDTYVRVVVSRIEDDVVYFNTLEGVTLDTTRDAVEGLPVDAIPLAVVLDDGRLALKNGICLTPNQRSGRSGISIADLLIQGNKWGADSALFTPGEDATVDAFVTVVDSLLSTHEALLTAAAGGDTDITARLNNIEVRLESREVDLDAAATEVGADNMAGVATYVKEHVEDTFDSVTAEGDFDAHGLGENFFRKDIAFPATTDDHLIGASTKVVGENRRFSYGVQALTAGNLEDSGLVIPVTDGSIELAALYTFAKAGSLEWDSAAVARFPDDLRAQRYLVDANGDWINDPDAGGDAAAVALRALKGGRLRAFEVATDEYRYVRTGNPTDDDEVTGTAPTELSYSAERAGTPIDFTNYGDEGYDVTTGEWSLEIRDGNLAGVYRVTGSTDGGTVLTLDNSTRLPTDRTTGVVETIRFLPPRVEIEFNGMVKGGFDLVYPNSRYTADVELKDDDETPIGAGVQTAGYIYVTTGESAIYVGREHLDGEPEGIARWLRAGYRVTTDQTQDDGGPVEVPVRVDVVGVEYNDGAEWIDVTAAPNYGETWFKPAASGTITYRLKVDLKGEEGWDGSVNTDLHLIEGVTTNNFQVTGEYVRIGETTRPVYATTDDEVNRFVSIADETGVRFAPDVTAAKIGVNDELRLYQRVGMTSARALVYAEATIADPQTRVRPFIKLDRTGYLAEWRRRPPTQVNVFYGSLAPLHTLASNETALLVQGKSASDSNSEVIDRLHEIRGVSDFTTTLPSLTDLNQIITAAKSISRRERLVPEIQGLVLRTVNTAEDRGLDYFRPFRNPWYTPDELRSNLMLYAGTVGDLPYANGSGSGALRLANTDDHVIKRSTAGFTSNPFTERPVYYVVRETGPSAAETLMLRFSYAIPQTFKEWTSIDVDLYHNMVAESRLKPAFSIGLVQSRNYGAIDPVQRNWGDGSIVYDYVTTSHGFTTNRWKYTPISFTPGGESGASKTSDGAVVINHGYNRNLSTVLPYAGNQLVFTAVLHAADDGTDKFINALGEITLNFRDTLDF